MAHYGLRDYLTQLDQVGELRTVNQEVDWNLEVGAIVQRLAEKGGPAVHFSRVKESQHGATLLGGLMSRGTKGIWTKLAVALNMEPLTPYRGLLEEVVKRIEAPIKPLQVSGGLCKEKVVTGGDVDLSSLPFPYLHADDGGRYASSWAFTAVQDPGSGYTSWEVLPQMLVDKNKLTANVPKTSALARLFFEKYEPANEAMPFVTVLGAVPVATMAAALKRRRGSTTVTEIAGGLQREPLHLVRCETNNLLVPASAEMVIEGVILPNERAVAGPFSESFGYRSLPSSPSPVFEVHCITHRADPILPFSTWGTPIGEIHLVRGVDCDTQLRQAFTKRGWPVLDVFTPPWLAGSLVAVSTKVPFSAFAQSVGGVVRSTEGTKTTPYILVCDDDVDITSPVHLFHALVTKCHPQRDTWIIKESLAAHDAPYLEGKSRQLGKGAAAIFDCTWPLDWDRSIAVPPKVSFDQCYPKNLQQQVTEEWSTVLGFPEPSARPAAH